MFIASIFHKHILLFSNLKFFFTLMYIYMSILRNGQISENVNLSKTIYSDEILEK